MNLLSISTILALFAVFGTFVDAGRHSLAMQNGGGIRPANGQNSMDGVGAGMNIGNNKVEGNSEQSWGHFAKKVVIYSLLMGANVIGFATTNSGGMGNSNFGGTYQQQYGGDFRGHRDYEREYNNGKGAMALRQNNFEKLPDNNWACQKVITGEGAQKRVAYKCTVELEAEKEEGVDLMAKTENEEEFVKVARIEPNAENGVKIDTDGRAIVWKDKEAENEANAEEEEEEGWTKVVSKKTQKNMKKQQKSMMLKTGEFLKHLEPVDEGKVALSRQDEIDRRCRELEKLFAHPRSRNLLQAPPSVGPDQVHEHVLWNDEHGKYSILTRIRHIIVQTPTVPGPNPAPSSYTMWVSFSPYYRPDKTTQFDAINVTAPSAPKAPPAPNVATPNGTYDIGMAPAPVTNDPSGKLPFTYMTVCTDTPTRDLSLCSWVDLDKDGVHAHFCNGIYYNDGTSASPDQSYCKVMKKCALSDKGC